MRAASVLSTTAVFASWRFFFAFLFDIKCRREACARNTLPVAVTLKRLATAFLVLRRAIGFGMGAKKLGSFGKMTMNFFCRHTLTVNASQTKFAAVFRLHGIFFATSAVTDGNLSLQALRPATRRSLHDGPLRRLPHEADSSSFSRVDYSGLGADPAFTCLLDDTSAGGHYCGSGF